MTSGPRGVIAALPALQGIPAQVEVTYPYPVADHMRLVAGSMPDTSPSSGIQVVVTAQTASAWGLRPGSQVAVIAPLQTTISGNGPPNPSFKLNLDVTGIVEPTDPDSSFWKADPLLAAPNLYVSQSKLWEGAFIADPGEIAMMQEIFGLAGLSIRWELPVATTGLRAQAPALYSEMKQFTLQTPQLTGLLAPMSNALSTSSALLGPLATLVAASNGVNVLLWMVYVGLAVAGVVMMLLAARMVAARRSAEMAVRRARGASLAAPVLARVLRRGGGRRASRRAGLGARRAPRPWPWPHRLGRLVAGHRDAGSRHSGSRGGGGLAAPPATPQAVRGAGTRTMAQTLGDQSDLRGHRLRRGHRRHHRLAATRWRRRPVYERGSAARGGPGRDRGAAAVPAAASRAGAGIGSPARRHRLPRPHPRRAGQRHARAPGHNARPHPHHGRVHHHGAGCGGSRRDCGVMAGNWR